MPLQVIKPSELRELEGANRIRFEVDGYNTNANVYRNVINTMRETCTVRVPTEEVASIYQIPVTKNDPLDPVCLVHFFGEFDGVRLNHLLLIEKSSLYFYAMNVDKTGKAVDGWREVRSSKKPIEGALRFEFDGAYHEMRNQGLMNEKISFGFGVLMRAIVNLVTGNWKVVHFLNVCVNLCEPVRIPGLVDVVANTMNPPPYGLHLYTPIPMTNERMGWILLFGKSSTAILKFRSSHEGQGITVESFNNDDVYEIIRGLGVTYGVIKCEEN